LTAALAGGTEIAQQVDSEYQLLTHAPVLGGQIRK
jgi:hypothetical protein